MAVITNRTTMSLSGSTEGRAPLAMVSYAVHNECLWIRGSLRPSARWSSSKSFSQAAERLGVTQPAVSLQVRSLEERLGRQLLDRSGRRVEPTEAGLRLYRSAQRMLAARDTSSTRISPRARPAPLHGTLAIGASTGPGGHLVPLLLCEFQRDHPELQCRAHRSRTRRPSSTTSPTASSSSASSARSAATARSSSSRSSADEIVLAVPPGHPFAGRDDPARRAARETLIVMQEGAGVRQVIEDELRRAGLRSARPRVAARARAPGVGARAPSPAGYGVTFISRTAIEAELAAGTLAAARVEGSSRRAQIYVVRGAGRARAGPRRRSSRFARESHGRDRPLGARRAARRARRARRRAAAARRQPSAGDALELPVAEPLRRRAVARGRTGVEAATGRPRVRTASSPSAAAARSTPRRPSPPRPACRSSPSRRRTPAPSGRPSSDARRRTARRRAAAAARTSPGSSTTRS